jgi:hypothetical protein
VEVLGPRTAILAANRDEDPARPSDPPLILSDRPRVVGGRDRRAGGTWLALRGRLAAVAMLNRRPRGPLPIEPGDERGPSSGNPGERSRNLRSRGLLALDVAAAGPDGDGTARALLERAESRVRAAPYAPFSLVIASPAGCWLLAYDGGAPPRAIRIDPGWHVLTHEDLDDPREPRAAWLARELWGWVPASRDLAEARLTALLGLHAGDAAPGSPAVCLHDGPMRTVSAARVWLAPGEAAYHHAEGRPCTASWTDVTPLLDPPPHAG